MFVVFSNTGFFWQRADVGSTQDGAGSRYFWYWLCVKLEREARGEEEAAAMSYCSRPSAGYSSTQILLLSASRNFKNVHFGVKKYM